MGHITVYGIRSGERTLTVVVGDRTAWYDLDRKVYAFHQKGKKEEVFSSESAFADYIWSLRNRTTPQSLGEELYSAMESGERQQIKLLDGHAETGLKLPNWLLSQFT